jgi:N6-adenosine-specific RNA methylase IME4
LLELRSEIPKRTVPLTDDAEKVVSQLKTSHSGLYRCLEVTVRASLRWTLDDVRLNGGIFVEDNDEDTSRKPPEMVGLETRLCGKRSFNVSRFPLG